MAVLHRKMFKFDFDVDDADDELRQSFDAPLDKDHNIGPIDLQPFSQVRIPDLVRAIPFVLTLVLIS